jgi:hypothetical protein
MLTALPPREPGQAVRNPFSRPGQSSITLTKRPRPTCVPVKRHAPSPMPSTGRDEGHPGIAPSPKILKASHPQPSKEPQTIHQPDLPRDLTPYRHLAMITSYPLPSLRTGDMPLPKALALRCSSTPSDHPLPSLISWTYGGKERSGRTRTNIERLLARPIRQLSQEDRAELALVEEEESLWQRVWQGFLDGWMSSGPQREVWYRNSLFALTASADLATINSTTIALRRALTDHGGNPSWPPALLTTSHPIHHQSPSPGRIPTSPRKRVKRQPSSSTRIPRRPSRTWDRPFPRKKSTCHISRPLGHRLAPPTS